MDFDRGRLRQLMRLPPLPSPRLHNIRFFFPIPKARSAETEILACKAFEFCPRGTGSQKCDCLAVYPRPFEFESAMARTFPQTHFRSSKPY